MRIEGKLLLMCLVLGLVGCTVLEPREGGEEDPARSAAGMPTLGAIDQALADYGVPEPPGESPGGALDDIATPPEDVLDALLPGEEGRSVVQGEERFDVSVRDLPARDFFMGLVRGTRYNMLVHPEVLVPITLELNQVTVPQVVDLVTELHGLNYEESAGVYRIFPAGVKTRIYPLDYLNVRRKGSSDIVVSSGQLSGSSSGSSTSSDGSGEVGGDSTTGNVLSRISTETESDFWGVLQKTISDLIGPSKDHMVVVDRSAGLVIVRASPVALRSVETYLRRSQLILQRQVILEARVLEVVLDKGFEQGINWSYFDTFTSSVDAAGSATKALTLGQASQQVINNDLGGVFSASLRLNDFSAFIQLLGTQGSVQVLSSPRIATINNQKAVIKVGSDEFFVTGIETSEDTSDSSENLISNVELTPFFSGIALDVTPQIGDEGLITLHVHPTVSEVVDQVKTVTLSGGDLVLPLAFSTVRETDSVITARNGQVVVIGGLLQNIDRRNRAETPLLADVPWFGELFRQHRNESSKSELVILIKPTLAEDWSPSRDAENLRDRFHSYHQPLDGSATSTGWR